MRQQIHSGGYPARIRQTIRQLLLVPLLLVCLTASASAQLSIQIGGSEAEFRQWLAREGYDRIDTRKIGLSNSSFHACKNGKRYRVKFEWTGKVDRKVIGSCRSVLDEAAVRKQLRQAGYRRITIEDRAGKFLAIGCRDDQRYRVEVNYYGDIGRERRIGDCHDALSPQDVTARLEEQGYDRVNFTDRQLPKYVAEACSGRNRMELVINRFGEIASSRRIGACRTGIDPDEITSRLREDGFVDIVIIDGNLPRYVASACKEDRRFEITLNRWGEITDRVRTGRCRTEFTAAEVEQTMQDGGFSNITVIEKGNRFITRGCRDNRHHHIVLARSGKLVERRELGRCNGLEVGKLGDILRKRGFSRLQFSVEGCEDRNRVRIHFDEFANRMSKETVGKCDD
ncbi:hypothetical protein [Salaquimonas pukyongi]|uniref:hypothetical protein n=1 Tax=Salaquimonas pukyongi TaxID=2712698 RepID=UPI00096BAE47|nr:hypothetical protein [Salaquimonas pukyongi]